jgi:hypothetical protein
MGEEKSTIRKDLATLGLNYKENYFINMHLTEI